MITVLSGGTGTPKLLQGIKEVVRNDELSVIVNTLENNYFSGVYVAADIDTVMYTMSNLINEETWYGMKDDTFHTHEQLKKYGFNETLRIGDRDRALKIQKTLLMQEYSLTDAVKIQSQALGIIAGIYPMSNVQPTVTIKTEKGNMAFHDFLIRKRGEPEVLDVIYGEVPPTDEVIESLEMADQIIIGPSNPVTSINPIISMPGIKKILKKSYVTAVSPIVGENAVSGPASKFMKARGYEVSPVGVAKIYEDFLDHYIINTTDDKYKHRIQEFIPEVSTENIIFNTLTDKINMARKILQDE